MLRNAQCIFPPILPPLIPLVSSPSSPATCYWPLRRVHCVGRNYALHVAEMRGAAGGGNCSNKDEGKQPVFFQKPTIGSVVNCCAYNASADASSRKKSNTVKYPASTSSLHYEVEMVIGVSSFLSSSSTSECLKSISCVGVGVDLTRRDLQSEAKKLGKPWDDAKSFDMSAPVSSMCMVGPNGGELEGWWKVGEIELKKNGVVMQSSMLKEMIMPPEVVVSALSATHDLDSGDVIFTGTPEGVGECEVGDRIEFRMFAGEEELRGWFDVV